MLSVPMHMADSHTTNRTAHAAATAGQGVSRSGAGVSVRHVSRQVQPSMPAQGEHYQRMPAVATTTASTCAQRQILRPCAVHHVGGPSATRRRVSTR